MAEQKPFAQSQVAIHKLRETPENFLPRRTSVFCIVQQWRNLQTSLSTVRNSLASRVRVSDSEERQQIVDSVMKSDECDKKNVIELYNRLYDELESREKRKNDERARLECKERLIGVAKRELELKEVEIEEKCKALELKETEIKEKCEAAELKLKCMYDRQVWFQAREADMDRRGRKIEADSKELNRRRKKIVRDEKKVKELQRAFELMEKDRIASLESKETELEERCKVIKLNEERAMNEICRAVEWRLKRMNEGFDAMVKHSLVGVSRGNEIGDVSGGLRLKRMNEGFDAMEMEQKRGRKHGLVGVLRRNEIGDVSGGLRLKRTNEGFDAMEKHSLVGVSRGNEIGDVAAGLSLKRMNEGFDAMGKHSLVGVSRGNEIGDVSAGLSLKRMNEGFDAMEKHGLVGVSRGNEIGDVSGGLRLKRMKEGFDAMEKHGLVGVSRGNDHEIGDVSGGLRLKRMNEGFDAMGKHSLVGVSRGNEIGDVRAGLSLKRMNEGFDAMEKHGLVGVSRGNDHEIGDVSGGLRLKRMNEGFDAMEKHSLVGVLREDEIGDVSGGLRLKRMNEGFDAMEMEWKRGRKHGLVDELKLLGKQDVDEYIESQCLIDEQINESSNKLELKEEKQVDAPCEDLGLVGIPVVESIEPSGLVDDKINVSGNKLESKEKEVQVMTSDKSVLMKGKEVSGKALDLKVNREFDLTRQPEDNKVLMNYEGAQLEIKQIGADDDAVDGHIVTCSFVEPESELPHSNVYDLYDRRVSPSSVEVYSEVQMLCSKMDADDMRSYRCSKEHNLLHEKIFSALRSASDPAKLVLDISRSFFETGLDEDDNDVIRTKCIFLLEQLIKLSPFVTPDVEHEAREFAGFWKERLDSWARPFSITHFGYLHFIAAFKLAESCKRKSLLSHFKASYDAAKLYPPEKNVDLCRALGIHDKIPDFVRSLIQRPSHLEAVKCISLLKMECEFPIVPLLEAYLEHVKQKFDEKLKTKNLQQGLTRALLEEVVKLVFHETAYIFLEWTLGDRWTFTETNEDASGLKVDATAIERSHLLRGALTSIQNLRLDTMLPTDWLSLHIKQLEEMQGNRMTPKASRKRSARAIRRRTVQLEKRQRIASGVSSCAQSKAGD